jgi:hypothetical protein
MVNLLHKQFIVCLLQLKTIKHAVYFLLQNTHRNTPSDKTVAKVLQFVSTKKQQFIGRVFSNQGKQKPNYQLCIQKFAGEIAKISLFYENLR